MATFCILVAPLPFPVRKRLFTFLSTSTIVAKVAYGLKISFMYVVPIFPTYMTYTRSYSSFVGILFLDALQRMFRVTAETDMAKSGKGAMPDMRAESTMHARKF